MTIHFSFSMHDFTNQDLRNLSFQGRDLQGANFSGADIRGCNFSHAILQDANFETVKAGREPIQFVRCIAIAVVACLVSFHAYSQMLFSIVGLTAEDPALVYIYPLQACLGIAALGTVVKSSSKLATTIASASSGSLLGFFYIGTFAAKNSQLAAWGAVAGAIALALLFLWQQPGWMQIAIAALRTVAAYGLTFLFVARASAYLSVSQVSWGIFWSILSLIFIANTIAAWRLTMQQIEMRSTTSFCHANLTGTKFTGARLGNTNFIGAIGNWNC